MFHYHNGTAAVYNKTLGQLRDIAREVAQEEGVPFADVHEPMMAACAKAKAKFGAKYHTAGADGIHPDRNGHLVMAYAFLKALGCDGDIGTIRVDLAAGKAEATGRSQGAVVCQWPGRARKHKVPRFASTEIRPEPLPRAACSSFCRSTTS